MWEGVGEREGVDLNSQICRMTITIIITITIKTQLQQPQLQAEEEDAEETLQRQQQEQHREFYKQQNVQLTTYNKKVVSTNSQSSPCVCVCVCVSHAEMLFVVYKKIVLNFDTHWSFHIRVFWTKEVAESKIWLF